MNKIDIKSIAIALLIIVIVLLQFCRREPIVNPPITTIDTIYSYDTITIEKQGENIYKDTTIYSTVYDTIIIDTNKILKEFFAKNVYKDTIILKDSVGKIIIEDTISMNEIQFRTVKADIISKTIIKETTLPYIPKRQLYWGVQGGFDKVSLINSASAGLIYKSKKDVLYQLNVGVHSHPGSEITPYVGAGIYWKIKLK